MVGVVVAQPDRTVTGRLQRCRVDRRDVPVALDRRAQRLAAGLVEAGEAEAAFFMSPTPVEPVRDVAAAGVNMPPKSTYFFPKVLTGMVFNPLTGS